MVLRAGKFGKFWGCTRFPDCKGTHGAHQADGKPLGIPADHLTKQARISAHAAFDMLWKSKKMTRSEAYRWLQQAMNLPKDEVHIGRFTVDQCASLIALVRAREVNEG